MAKRMKVSDSSYSVLNSSTRSGAAPDPNHALADLMAWHQKLVARGDRIFERAMREREALAVRDASPGSWDARADAPRSRRASATGQGS